MTGRPGLDEGDPLVISEHLHQDEEGATAVEYGLLVALVAAVIIGTVATLGTDLMAAYNSVVGTF
jgi:pilus assembly protein Flp/PilA